LVVLPRIIDRLRRCRGRGLAAHSRRSETLRSAVRERAFGAPVRWSSVGGEPPFDVRCIAIANATRPARSGSCVPADNGHKQRDGQTEQAGEDADPEHADDHDEREHCPHDDEVGATPLATEQGDERGCGGGDEEEAGQPEQSGRGSADDGRDSGAAARLGGDVGRLVDDAADSRADE
jgi:hypothetical protein